MWTRQHKRRNTGVLIVPAITVVFVSYFAFHAFHGEYGLEARKSLASRTTALKERLEDVREERKAFEHKVALLKDGTLERDMLDLDGVDMPANTDAPAPASNKRREVVRCDITVSISREF